ncbi:hypothetical protein B0H10DRAFT_2038721 [Mycena sp. CBHHK59/15]|nr:hypothetical protein B0H10DRAFT_2038721 [Mycena sp. CBHHK59/15]
MEVAQQLTGLEITANQKQISRLSDKLRDFSHVLPQVADLMTRLSNLEEVTSALKKWSGQNDHRWSILSKKLNSAWDHICELQRLRESAEGQLDKVGSIAQETSQHLCDLSELFATTQDSMEELRNLVNEMDPGGDGALERRMELASIAARLKEMEQQFADTVDLGQPEKSAALQETYSIINPVQKLAGPPDYYWRSQDDTIGAIQVDPPIEIEDPVDGTTACMSHKDDGTHSEEIHRRVEADRSVQTDGSAIADACVPDKDDGTHSAETHHRIEENNLLLQDLSTNLDPGAREILPLPGAWPIGPNLTEIESIFHPEENHLIEINAGEKDMVHCGWGRPNKPRPRSKAWLGMSCACLIGLILSFAFPATLAPLLSHSVSREAGGIRRVRSIRESRRRDIRAD